jgi:hypothetical protein
MKPDLGSENINITVRRNLRFSMILQTARMQSLSSIDVNLEAGQSKEIA